MLKEERYKLLEEISRASKIISEWPWWKHQLSQASKSCVTKARKIVFNLEDYSD